MKIEINLEPDEILGLASRSEKRLFFEQLEDQFIEDIEDQVKSASHYKKRDIFNYLLNDGYGDDLFNEDDSSSLTIENKRYMMDKSDDDMLMYLIDKYKYFK